MKNTTTNSNSNTFPFSVATGNIGHSPYMFMWGNPCGLNADGQKFIQSLQAQMDALKAEKKFDEAKALGANTVKQLVLNGDYLKYSTSPHREFKIRTVLTALFANRPNCMVGFQEVGPQSLKLICPENSSVANSAMFDLSLKADSEKDLEKILERGNAIISNVGSNDDNRCVGSFSVSFDRSNEQKNQTRRAACSVFDIASLDTTSSARVCVCSLHVSGYWGGGYTLATPKENETPQESATRLKNLEGYKKSYQEGQTELQYYAEQIESEARERGTDILVLAGDFNSCGNTNDHVEKAGLKTRQSVLLERGFVEDASANETTTFDPKNPKHVSRRLDRIFYKNLTNNFRVALNTRLQNPPNGITFQELSDHALFVTGDFVLEKMSSKI